MTSDAISSAFGPAMFVELTQAPKLETVRASRNIGERSRGDGHAQLQTFAPHSLLSLVETAGVSKDDSRSFRWSRKTKESRAFRAGTVIADRRWTACCRI